MKRTFRIFLFAAILAAFLMGCSPLLPVSPSGETAVPSEPSAPPATTAPTEEPAPTFDDSVLGEAYTNEGTFTDAWGSDWSYSLHVPRLLLDSPAAEELNSKIHRDLSGIISSMETAIEQSTPAELCSVRWERVWTDSIVSLAVIVEYAEGTSHYYIYHFDCANSIELDSAHMLRRLGISMDDYTAAVRRAAAQAFDRQYAGADPAIGGGAAYLLQLRAMTVAAAGNSDPVPFLPNEDGSLRIFPSIGSIAGAGWYMTPLTVSFGSAETGTGAPIQSNSSDVWAAITLDGTGLQVSFESSGKNYPVSGCYADYTALLAANIGPDAYVFALTAGGFVEAVNMTACSRFETFCSMGPLYGLSGITSLEAGNGTAYAVDAGGAKHDLLPLVQSVESGFSAILSGVIWGIIPAFFKAHWNTNETLFTLMMNYVAIQLVEYFLKVADKTGSNVVGPDLLTHGWFPEIFGVKYLLNILIVAIVCIAMHIYLRYSKHGYEIAVVGESENTAHYIGIDVKKVIIRTMALSGAICGLAGLLLVGGSSHSIDSNLVDGRGFTAIMVSWLAKFDPFTMILTTLLLVFLARGADEVTSKFGLNSDFSEILTGIILFFIIGCEFFINYQVHFNYHKKEKTALAAVSGEGN